MTDRFLVDPAEIKQLADVGMRARQIAIKLGIHLSSVYRIADNYSITFAHAGAEEPYQSDPPVAPQSPPASYGRARGETTRRFVVDPAEIQELADTGLKAGQIAIKMGIHLSTVNRVVKKYSLTIPRARKEATYVDGPPVHSVGRAETPFWVENRQKIIDDYKAGKSYAQIAAEIGVTRNAIAGKIHNLGIAERKKKEEPKRCLITFPPPGGCVWPYGHPNTEKFRFCGKSAREGKPYCESHHRRAYRPPEEEAA